MNLTGLSLILYAVLGALVCIVGLFIRSCLQDYMDISSGLGIESDAELRSILYRCKQHYQFIGKYGLFTNPDYFTLEKELVKCKHNGISKACSNAVLAANNLATSSSFQESLSPIYRLVHRILQKLLFPVRSEHSGPIETDSRSSRLSLNQIILQFAATISMNSENER